MVTLYENGVSIRINYCCLPERVLKLTFNRPFNDLWEMCQVLKISI